MIFALLFCVVHAIRPVFLLVVSLPGVCDSLIVHTSTTTSVGLTGSVQVVLVQILWIWDSVRINIGA